MRGFESSDLCICRFLDAMTQFFKRFCPSVRSFVPCYFQTTNMVVFEGKMSSKDNANGVLASDVLVLKRVCPNSKGNI